MRFSLIFRHLLATHFSSGSTALIDDLEMQAAPPPRDNEARRRASPGSGPAARFAHRALPYPARNLSTKTALHSGTGGKVQGREV